MTTDANHENDVYEVHSASDNSHDVRGSDDVRNDIKDSAGDDHLSGGAKDDLVELGGGDDRVDGGAGLDVAVYAHTHANYVARKSATGFEIQDNTGADGTDALINIERAKFSDGTLALDVGKWQTSGEAYRMYQAAFKRAPDDLGLKYWISQMDSGQSNEQVAHNFIVSDEFKSLYGASASSSDLVTAFYENVLHRAPDQSGFAYWAGLLEQKKITPEQLLINFSESDENVAAVGVSINDGIWLT